MSLGHLLMIPGLNAAGAAPQPVTTTTTTLQPVTTTTSTTTSQPTTTSTSTSSTTSSTTSQPPPLTLDILASVGTSLTPTITGTKAVTGIGFQPKVVMPFTALQPSTASSAGANTTFGIGTASLAASVSSSSQGSLTTSNAYKRHTGAAILSALASDASLYAEATLASRDASGFTYNYTTVQLTSMVVNHICLGGADLEVSLTQHQMNNTNAAQSFAHGLSGAPTGVILITALNSLSPPVSNAHASMGLSFYANGVQQSSAVQMRNALTTTATSKILSPGLQAQSGTNAAWLRAMNITSLDATNVNCSYSGAGSTATHFWMLAIRGAKCQVGTFDCNGSLDPLTISTTGIIPKLFLGCALAECVDNYNVSRDHVNFSIFASDGTNNVSCGMTDLDNVTTTTTYRHQSSTDLQEITAVDGAQRFSATASFSGQSVLLDPTVNQGISWGQGAYIVIGA